MSRTVFCRKMQKSLPGLDFVPFKGELGERIHQHISADAWRQWLAHSTMVINEYRLNPAEPEAQKTLFAQLEKFLFGEQGEVSRPKGYVPPTR